MDALVKQNDGQQIDGPANGHINGPVNGAGSGPVGSADAASAVGAADAADSAGAVGAARAVEAADAADSAGAVGGARAVGAADAAGSGAVGAADSAGAVGSADAVGAAGSGAVGGARAVGAAGAVGSAGAAGSAQPAVSVSLIGGLVVRSGGEPVALTRDAQRLVALLAIRRPRVARPVAAGTLWFDAGAERARANLRSAIWRVRKQIGRLVDSDGAVVGLKPSVQVDLDEIDSAAERLADPERRCGPADLALSRYRGELLPGWYDDWVLVERERVRQLCLHALEAVTHRLIAAGRHGAAVQAGLAAIEADPLRESAHRCLVAAHLAEGNRSEALRQFDRYSSLLAAELDATPSQHMVDLVSGSPALPPR